MWKSVGRGDYSIEILNTHYDFHIDTVTAGVVRHNIKIGEREEVKGSTQVNVSMQTLNSIENRGVGTKFKHKFWN